MWKPHRATLPDSAESEGPGAGTRVARVSGLQSKPGDRKSDAVITLPTSRGRHVQDVGEAATQDTAAAMRRG